MQRNTSGPGCAYRVVWESEYGVLKVVVPVAVAVPASVLRWRFVTATSSPGTARSSSETQSWHFWHAQGGM